MHTKLSHPPCESDSNERRLTPLDRDLELLALWAAALHDQGYEVGAGTGVAQELVNAGSKLGFVALSFRPVAGTKHTS